MTHLENKTVMNNKNNINRAVIFNSIILLIILLLTGILLSLLIALLLNRFSLRMLKISSLNSVFLSLGIFLNYFLINSLYKKVNKFILGLLSFSLLSGISIAGFIYLFLIEPLFFFYRTNVLFTYLFVNFLFILILSVITNGYIFYTNRITEINKKLTDEIDLRKEIEEKLLLSTLNPHFLFNSLNLVISLLGDKKKAEEAVLNLSDILRYSTDADPLTFIDISKEAEVVKKYLWLQKLRFNERLEYSVNCDAGGKILPMILQPLIENSIKHNMSNVKKLIITLDIKKEDAGIVIEISDSERKIKEEDIGKGKGLLITKKRIEIINGSFIIKDGGIIIKYKS